MSYFSPVFSWFIVSAFQQKQFKHLLHYHLRLNMLSNVHLKLSMLKNVPVPKVLSHINMYSGGLNW
jgi:hypothetical protein